MAARWLALAALLVAVQARRASASAEDDFFVGNRAAMTGGAVVATVADGSASYYNHAGLASVTHSRLDVSASVYALRFYKVDGFLGVEGGPSADASVTEFVAIPTEIAYVRPLGDNVSLGLGYFVPKAENALLSQRLDVQEDGETTSRWGLDVHESASNYALVAALGWQLSRRLSIGMGLFGLYADTTTSLSFFGEVREDGATLSAIEASTLSTSTRLGGSAGAGIQADLGHGFALGLWARAPALQFFSSGEDSINAVLGMPDDQGVLQLGTISDALDISGDQIGFVTLGRYHAGLAYRSGPTSLSIELDVQPGLRNRGTDVDRQLTINGRAGVLHTISDGILLGAGVFTDRDTTADDITRADYYGATAGVEFDDVFALALDERASSLTLSTVFALRYAYGTGKSATLRPDPAGDVTGFLATGRGAEQNVHELGLHVGSSLRF